MSSPSALAYQGDGCDRARLAAADRGRLIARRLQCFPARYRAHVAALAARDPRLADLALSFPALLFALAVPRVGFAAEPLIALVLAGAPLKRLARLAGLPMWSRRLMPEAFAAPMGELPDGERLACQLGNYLPGLARHAARWLEAVTFMTRYATSDAAVWIAREVVRQPGLAEDDRMPLVALYVWFSLHPETLCGSLAFAQWQPDMSWQSAMDQAEKWLERVTLHAFLGNHAVTDPWLTLGSYAGLEFHPLLSAADVDGEAEAMRHCVRCYGDSVALGRSRLWSVRRAGERVATLEIMAEAYGGPLIGIAQLQGPQNSTVDRDVWWAVVRWLVSHDLPSIATECRNWGSLFPDGATWRALWRPYWLAKRHLPEWLPLAPSYAALNRLSRRYRVVRRRPRRLHRPDWWRN